mmetsp:Transcript_136140/g.303250  ORF Transcript_136140/g.303250 Transcript_136140/m.303250 type:complete len:251 (-) Transcript_136140:48-800(-)
MQMARFTCTFFAYSLFVGVVAAADVGDELAMLQNSVHVTEADPISDLVHGVADGVEAIAHSVGKAIEGTVKAIDTTNKKAAERVAQIAEARKASNEAMMAKAKAAAEQRLKENNVTASSSVSTASMNSTKNKDLLKTLFAPFVEATQQAAADIAKAFNESKQAYQKAAEKYAAEQKEKAEEMQHNWTVAAQQYAAEQNATRSEKAAGIAEDLATAARLAADQLTAAAEQKAKEAAELRKAAEALKAAAKR